jgi:hypothetical protein
LRTLQALRFNKTKENAKFAPQAGQAPVRKGRHVGETVYLIALPGNMGNGEFQIGIPRFSYLGMDEDAFSLKIQIRTKTLNHVNL